jgi:mRNA interferase RelE/StbE
MNRKTPEDHKTLDERASYELLQLPRVRRQLNRLLATHHSVIKGIVEAIESLADTPRPPRVEKLVGLAEWRIRVGDYRVRYLIDDRNKKITITAVAHRRDVYR